MSIISKQIGWSQESNLLYEILRQLNRLTSTIFGLSQAAAPKYKVYTALLSQSGPSNPITFTSGILIVGVTYNIDAYHTNDDFSNVGGPGVGVEGQYDGFTFLATGTTPNNWTNVSSLIYDTGAPVVTVLENTIGNIYWTYVSPGVYFANLTGAFPEGKTYQVIGDSYGVGSINRVEWNNVNGVLVQTLLYTFTPDDNLLDRTPIEIRVYN
jgi:hypothetical protein